ncbi:MAG: hypothetical protein OHK0029_28960 [Armatimonadaceae bacterium]
MATDENEVAILRESGAGASIVSPVALPVELPEPHPPISNPEMHIILTPTIPNHARFIAASSSNKIQVTPG